MMFRNKIRALFVCGVAALALHPLASNACSACYGDPNSSMSKGLTWGITALLVVVVGVLTAISTFFVYVAKKSPTDKDKES